LRGKSLLLAFFFETTVERTELAQCFEDARPVVGCDTSDALQQHRASLGARCSNVALLERVTGIEPASRAWKAPPGHPSGARGAARRPTGPPAGDHPRPLRTAAWGMTRARPARTNGVQTSRLPRYPACGGEADLRRHRITGARFARAPPTPNLHRRCRQLQPALMVRTHRSIRSAGLRPMRPVGRALPGHPCARKNESNRDDAPCRRHPLGTWPGRRGPGGCCSLPSGSPPRSWSPWWPRPAWCPTNPHHRTRHPAARCRPSRPGQHPRPRPPPPYPATSLVRRERRPRLAARRRPLGRHSRRLASPRRRRP